MHVATERGSAGLWYITNSSGSWTSCQLSSGNDRNPSIAVGGGAIHVAFARNDAGERGIYTASSNQTATAVGCGWAITKRFAGKAGQPSMGAYGELLSIAFRHEGQHLGGRQLE